MGKLDGRVAIVTGASRGIGRDIARVLAREGAKVVVSARTMNEGDFRITGSIATTVQRIQDAGGTAIGVRCDVTNDDEVATLAQRTLEEFGGIDILVNNAAILIPGSTLELQVRHFDLLYRVNIRGPFICTKAVLPHMVEQRYGHILNISSGGGSRGRGPGPGPYESAARGSPTYGAGKAQLDQYTQGLAHELWDHNIAVNSMSPGTAVLSDGQVWIAGREGHEGWRENGEAMGDAAAIIFSREPRSYTGHNTYDNEVLNEEGITDFSRYPIVA